MPTSSPLIIRRALPHDRLVASTMLAACAAISLILSMVILDPATFRRMVLAGLIAYLLPSLDSVSPQRRRTLILISLSAALAIASDLIVSANSSSFAVTILVLIGAWTLQLAPDRLILLVPGSVLALLLISPLALIRQDPTASSSGAFLAAVAAALAASTVILPRIEKDPTTIPASVCASIAAISFAALSIDERQLWLVTAILSSAAASMFTPATPPPAISTVKADLRLDSLPAGIAILSFAAGCAAIAVAASDDAALGRSFLGVMFVGLTGLGGLYVRWWNLHLSQRNRLREAIRETRTDPLTKLLNRRAIDERMQIEIDRASRFGHPLSLLMVDLDDFKSINDLDGHLAGDAVLREVSATIDRSIRSIDIAGRYGGEEFIVLLPETDTPGAMVVAERIRASVETLGSATVSIGLAELANAGMTAGELIALADAALYEAKHAGKNRIVSAS